MMTIPGDQGAAEKFREVRRHLGPCGRHPQLRSQHSGRHRRSGPHQAQSPKFVGHHVHVHPGHW